MTHLQTFSASTDDQFATYDIDRDLLEQLEAGYPGVLEAVQQTLTKPGMDGCTVWYCPRDPNGDALPEHRPFPVSGDFATCDFRGRPAEAFDCLYIAGDGEDWWRDVRARIPLLPNAGTPSVLERDADINVRHADDLWEGEPFETGLTQVVYDRAPSRFCL